MYEKHGLMVKITNKEVLRFLRSHKETNVQLIERALCKVKGIEPRVFKSISKKPKKGGCENCLPIKISHAPLVQYVIEQKKLHGVCYRHTVESAMLNYIRG